MKKYRCNTCNREWFSDEAECYEDESHKVKEIKRLVASDYAEMWANDLESANRHSLTDMPDIILSRLIKHIPNRKIVTKIMKDFYNIGIGI